MNRLHTAPKFRRSDSLIGRLVVEGKMEELAKAFEAYESFIATETDKVAAATNWTLTRCPAGHRFAVTAPLDRLGALANRWQGDNSLR